MLVAAQLVHPEELMVQEEEVDDDDEGDAAGWIALWPSFLMPNSLSVICNLYVYVCIYMYLYLYVCMYLYVYA